MAPGRLLLISLADRQRDRCTPWRAAGLLNCGSVRIAALVSLLLCGLPAAGQSLAPGQSPVRLRLDQAIQMAIEHNHALKATRTQIAQSQAQEITAGLHPNPVLTFDSQFVPIFSPSTFSADALNQIQQFDVGVGYLFERGRKRQHRLEAAKDQTAVTRSQVADAERALALSVAAQFIGALLAESNLQFAELALKSFQQTADISNERQRAGDISEGDLLKIKLQSLQFQTDLSAARLSRVQALAGLRQLVGYESVPANFDVEGDLVYEPLQLNRDDLQALALRLRPDFLAADRAVIAAQSQHTLAQANAKRDLNAAFNYSHVSGISSGSFFLNIEIPIFNRNQGEIARTGYVVDQFQETRNESSQQVLTDVVNAYEAVRTDAQVAELYTGGYLKQAQDSRDISEYAYKHGAASLLDFLDAERNYRLNQIAYRQSLATYLLALEQLRAAVGTRSLP